MGTAPNARIRRHSEADCCTLRVITTRLPASELAIAQQLRCTFSQYLNRY